MVDYYQRVCPIQNFWSAGSLSRFNQIQQRTWLFSDWVQFISPPLRWARLQRNPLVIRRGGATIPLNLSIMVEPRPIISACMDLVSKERKARNQRGRCRLKSLWGLRWWRGLLYCDCWRRCGLGRFPPASPQPAVQCRNKNLVITDHCNGAC